MSSTGGQTVLCGTDGLKRQLQKAIARIRVNLSLMRWPACSRSFRADRLVRNVSKSDPKLPRHEFEIAESAHFARAFFSACRFQQQPEYIFAALRERFRAVQDGATIVVDIV